MVLAGGRGSRLGGLDKARLVAGGRMLLERSLDALAAADRVVVVGPAPDAAVLERAGSERVRSALEAPRFGGPVPALVAGLGELAADARTPQDLVLVLAVDLVRPADAVAGLLRAVRAESSIGADAIVAVDAAGVRQPVLAAYRRAPLVIALAELDADGGLDGAPLRRLLAGFEVAEAPLGEACDDVDTPEDAARFGVETARVAERAT
ncbi:NTP transferase domain-containing protein [Agromyces sp. MMS17-SY077]|uniref:NTP transferase domain-containing protein n=1 Tax=Agromyces seonyuensis TaxID=2662446 RepID=A0A6I4P0N1_9MICO|nr:NTP transferase domain-containing protein [Agromyces seonyuensis]